MIKTPHQILGIDSEATLKEAKAAFRKLALEHHPDRPNGDQVKFAEINQALEDIKDPEGYKDRLEREADAKHMRERSDKRAERNRKRKEKPKSRYERQYEKAKRRQRKADRRKSEDDAWDEYKRKWGPKPRPEPRPVRKPPEMLHLSFEEAAKGGLFDTVFGVVKVPPGVKSGRVIQTEAQDYLVAVQEHPYWTRKGNNVWGTVSYAAPGDALFVDTVQGRVRAVVPEDARGGSKLRIRGKGVCGGDHIIVLKHVVAPVSTDTWEALKAERDKIKKREV